MTLVLVPIKRSNPQLVKDMSNHYSNPKGFVGRNICYAIEYNGLYYGGIVGGSATLHLAGRDEFFGINKDNKNQMLTGIVNNIFYHVERRNDEYPTRNFTVKVLSEFRKTVITDWENKYQDKVIGFESLVELPRTGALYLKDDWTNVGQTVGYTCKRVAGVGTDSWTGKRVWNTKDLKPKLVFCKLR